MDDGKQEWAMPRKRESGNVSRTLFILGAAAELLIAAGGDGPTEPGVVSMYGLRTGLAIVGWWWAANAAEEVVAAITTKRLWRRMHCRCS